jgi:class 3 adenylate cyclase
MLADISGFTRFLAESELDHANAILSELTEMVVGQLTQRLRLAEVEGDAVYVYGPADQVDRPETLLELIEATYVKFRDRVEGVRRRTTCSCSACRSIPLLNLKFILHYGQYVEQVVAQRSKPLGSDVNLAHRLLKNTVSAATGWEGYALVSQPCFELLGLPADDWMAVVEDVVDFGQMPVYVQDLGPRYEALVDERRVYVSQAEAHMQFSYDLPIPPVEAWEWLNDPIKHGQLLHAEIVPHFLSNGRMGPGASNHCVHGEKLADIQTILDWRPFTYFTLEHEIQGWFGKALVETIEMAPTEMGSHLTHRFLVTRAPLWFGKWVFKTFVFPQFLATSGHFQQAVLNPASDPIPAAG